MSRLPSIRRRIAQSLIFGSLAWGLSVTGVVWASVHYSVNSLLDGALQESAEVLYGLLETHTDNLYARPAQVLPAPPHEENLVWQLVGPDQEIILKSHQAPSRVFRTSWKPGLSNADGGWRLYGIPLSNGQGILYVGQEIDDRSQAIMQATAVAAIGTLLVGFLFVFVLRKQIGQELRHLRKLSRNLAEFDPLTSGKVLPPVARAELQPIHRAIAELTQRLSWHVAQERAFAAHAAHALRTPLAGMDVQLAMALRECPPGMERRLQRTRDAMQRLTRVVTALITLFRHGADLKLQKVDVALLMDHTPSSMSSVEVESCGPIVADPDLLAAALMNLLDNAVRHGARHVKVRARASASRQLVVVQDDGPGVTAEQRLRIQQALRSQDLDGLHVGLGLKLTDMVARAHGGALRLLPSRVGFAVCLVLKPGEAEATHRARLRSTSA